MLGERLTVGDEPMDRLVAWMAEVGMAQTRPLFERALSDGIATVPDAPQPLREFFETYEARPDWVDPDTVRKGQRALRRGGADGMYVARDVSLLGGYQFSGFNKTLLRTGALEKGSNKRFAETMQWAMDVISEDGLEPLGLGYRSTIRVRLIHSLVRRHVSAMPDWRADEWGLPINQTDMAATLVGALVAPAVGVAAWGGPLARRIRRGRALDPLRGLADRRRRSVAANGFPRQRPGAGPHAVRAGRTGRIQPLAVPMVEDPLVWHYDVLPESASLAGARPASVDHQRLPGAARGALPGSAVLRAAVVPAAAAAGEPCAQPRRTDAAGRTGARRCPRPPRTSATDAHHDRRRTPATIGESAAHVGQVA